MLNKIEQRCHELVSALIKVHLDMLNKEVPKELVDLVAQDRGWDYKFTRDKLTLTPIEHDVRAQWTNPFGGAYLLQLHSGAFTLGIVFMEDDGIEYSYPGLKQVSFNSLRQTIGEIQALATIQQDVTYIGAIESLAYKINDIVKQVRQEARCEDLNVTMTELERIDDDIALSSLLERFGREYERYVLRSNLGRVNRPKYDGVARHTSDVTMGFSLRMGWLNIMLNVSKDGEFQYNMPILNLEYKSMTDLIHDRFSHLTSMGSWDSSRFAVMEFVSIERRIVELAVKILNYEELPEEDV